MNVDFSSFAGKPATPSSAGPTTITRPTATPTKSTGQQIKEQLEKERKIKEELAKEKAKGAKEAKMEHLKKVAKQEEKKLEKLKKNLKSQNGFLFMFNKFPGMHNCALWKANCKQPLPFFRV